MGGFKNKFLLNRHTFTIHFFKSVYSMLQKLCKGKKPLQLCIISTLSSKLGLGLWSDRHEISPPKSSRQQIFPYPT